MRTNPANRPPVGFTRREAKEARAAEAGRLYITGLSYRDIADQGGFGNPGNAYRLVQQFLEKSPDPGNIVCQRKVENLRLDAIWRLAWPAAEQGDVASLRVLLEVSRRRSALNGLDKRAVLQLEGWEDTAPAQHVPTLREVLPPEVAADPRLVREQALLLHRALPASEAGVASDE